MTDALELVVARQYEDGDDITLTVQENLDGQIDLMLDDGWGNLLVTLDLWQAIELKNWLEKQING
jgi:hypothetical protein